FFFFSSRRRHTRFSRDWSSDVCSSDLGSMMETAAHALGCTVFPGGVGQTEQQLQAMLDLQPAGYTGTPGFLRIILEKAQEQGLRSEERRVGKECRDRRARHQ